MLCVEMSGLSTCFPPPSSPLLPPQALGKKAVRERADLVVLGSVGAPMAGTILEVVVKTGEEGEEEPRVIVRSKEERRGTLVLPMPRYAGALLGHSDQ